VSRRKSRARRAGFSVGVAATEAEGLVGVDGPQRGGHRRGVRAHNAAILDGMAIIDHGSIDGTLQILTALAARAAADHPDQERGAGLPAGAADDGDGARRVPADGRRLRDAARCRRVREDPLARGVRPRAPAVPAPHERAHALAHLRARFLEGAAGHPRADREREAHVARAADVPEGADVALPARAARGHARERQPLRREQAPRDSDDAEPHARIRDEFAALAHVPIRSAAQFVTKVAVKKLGRIAAQFDWKPDAASQMAYEAVLENRPIDDALLLEHAINWSIPKPYWAKPHEVGLVDDPFLAPITLRYTPPAAADSDAARARPRPTAW
jgi:hypothetical protein